jgi:hypothetical protein
MRSGLIADVLTNAPTDVPNFAASKKEALAQGQGQEALSLSSR